MRVIPLGILILMGYCGSLGAEPRWLDGKALDRLTAGDASSLSDLREILLQNPLSKGAELFDELINQRREALKEELDEVLIDIEETASNGTVSRTVITALNGTTITAKASATALPGTASIGIVAGTRSDGGFSVTVSGGASNR